MSSPSADTQPSILALVSAAKEDATRLAKAQLELAQVEMKQSGQAAGFTAGMFIGAAVMAFLGFIFMWVTLAYVLVAVGLPVWAGFLIVTVVMLLIAGVLGLIGARKARSIKGPVLAKAEFEKTKAALSGSTLTGA
ncbi:MAG: phage holin family protein [Candidatus Nanopelagicales bacterium]